MNRNHFFDTSPLQLTAFLALALLMTSFNAEAGVTSTSDPIAISTNSPSMVAQSETTTDDEEGTKETEETEETEAEPDCD